MCCATSLLITYSDYGGFWILTSRALGAFSQNCHTTETHSLHMTESQNQKQKCISVTCIMEGLLLHYGKVYDYLYISTNDTLVNTRVVQLVLIFVTDYGRFYQLCYGHIINVKVQ